MLASSVSSPWLLLVSFTVDTPRLIYPEGSPASPDFSHAPARIVKPVGKRLC